MDRAAAVELIKQNTGFRQNNDDIIIAALKNSQEILSYGGVLTEAGYSTEVPWFLRFEDQTLPIVAGDTSVPLPEGFIREIDDEGPWFPDTSITGEPPVYLQKASPGASRRTFTGTTSGPQTYQIGVEDLLFWPAASEAMTLHWTYYKKDVVLSSNIENKWLLHVPSLLIGHAGQGIAAAFRDTEAVKEFVRLKLEGQKQLLTQNMNREFANRRTAFGVYR